MIQKYTKDLTYSYTEGFFPTFELLKNKKEFFKTLYVSPNAISSEGYLKLCELVDKKIVVSEKVFNKIASKENSHVIATFNKFYTELNKDCSHLVMVNPSDMGNLGNAMRSLLAFNFHDLAIIKPACDLFNPKTIRASMGAIFKIRIEEFDSFDEYLNKYERTYYPFVLSKAKNLNDVVFKKPCSLVFGNEATGLSEEIYNDNNIKIEQSDEVDSLNLTTSIAIGLYKLMMQK